MSGVRSRKTVDFQHLVVLKNPVSTHRHITDRHVAALKAFYPTAKLNVIETAPSATETEARLRRAQAVMGPDTLLCIAGGDGTANRVITWMLSDGSGQVRHTVLLPLWAGNANDLAHMANGPAFRTRLPLVLSRAAVVPVYPLECTLAREDGTVQVYYAASYAGFGVSATVAREINGSEHRKGWWQRILLGRLLAEIVTVGKAALGSNGFTIQEGRRKHVLRERSYINGSRMAKMQLLAADLTKQLFVQTTGHKTDGPILGFFRWLAGGVRPHPTSVTGRRSAFTVKDDIWMQVDGEPVRVAKNTRVTVRCTRQPVFLLSTRLNSGKRPPRARSPKKT